MMESRSALSTRLAVVAAVILATVGVAYLMRPKSKTAEAEMPAGTIYYTGPMKARNGSTYGAEDGSLVPDPNLKKTPR